MRSSKPAKTTSGVLTAAGTHGGGRSVRGWVAVAAMGLASAACSGTPLLTYQVRSLKEEGAGSAAVERKRTVTEFDHKRMLRFSESGGGLKLDVIFIKREAVRDVAERIAGDRGVLYRAPEIQPVRIHCYNYGDKTYHWDLYAFQLRNKDTKAVISPVRMESYLRTYYGHGSSALPFYWAFEQKDSFQFLHRIPEWQKKLLEPDTASPAEKEERRRETVRRVESGHSARTVLLPGREIKGYVLFPELDRGRYVLEYTDRSAQAVNFPPFEFEVRLVRETEEEKDQASEAVDKDVYNTFESEILDVDRELKEFHNMHRQLRAHDALREKPVISPDLKNSEKETEKADPVR